MVGDTISIFSDQAEFVYRVTQIKTVARTDTSLLQTTETPSLSLATCIGTWQPTLWDDTERLVVRGELVEAPRLASP